MNDSPSDLHELAAAAFHKTKHYPRVPSGQSVPSKPLTTLSYRSSMIWIWNTVIQWLFLAGHQELWCVIKLDEFENVLKFKIFSIIYVVDMYYFIQDLYNWYKIIL